MRASYALVYIRKTCVAGLYARHKSMTFTQGLFEDQCHARAPVISRITVFGKTGE